MLSLENFDRQLSQALSTQAAVKGRKMHLITHAREAGQLSQSRVVAVSVGFDPVSQLAQAFGSLALVNDAR